MFSVDKRKLHAHVQTLVFLRKQHEEKIHVQRKRKKVIPFDIFYSILFCHHYFLFTS